MDLRVGWANEASVFTPWLAEHDNLQLLGATLGLELELEGVEVNVGPFRADVLCRDVATDRLVLIENQLERTDHGHPGQTLTYQAGLDADTVIWIAAQFTEEHRAALDWLNQATEPRYRFFGVVVELWRIGDSPPAPRFDVVAKPNDWSNRAAHAARAVASGEQTELGARRRAYWEGFAHWLEARGSPLTLPGPHAGATLSIATGHAGLTLKPFRAADRIGVFLRIHGPDAAMQYRQLQAQEAALEAAIATLLRWSEREPGMNYWITAEINADAEDEYDWPQQFGFIERCLRAFQHSISAIFGGR
ncbi:hypothetical protein CKO42_08050 [Lamprobacter modestohalophilus]|uniref:DUF4268 domain-containing protein n=1 Tax=Lamprobacter modestohalophilus TaxID=1064514 RepID=A0A9X1B3G2_9GAMM|nr:hypothetical protein [Lamprobacter modestohalophilus]